MMMIDTGPDCADCAAAKKLPQVEASIGRLARTCSVEAVSGAGLPGEAPTRGRLPRIPALDGIRAVAVIAVLLFHAGVSWMPGGSFGVDVFFVLSGFLITALLVGERDRSGTIRLGSFYLRRARRLVPALVLVLLFVCVTWGLLLTTKTPTLRGDALATVTYVANWHFAFSGQGYFASFAAPSPLLHTWSLAVEEQFYLLWPLVVTFLLARGRSVARWAAALVVLSFLSMLIQSTGRGLDRSAVLRDGHPGNAAAARRRPGCLVHPAAGDLCPKSTSINKPAGGGPGRSDRRGLLFRRRAR